MKKEKKLKLKLTLKEIRTQFFKECSERFAYGDLKYGDKHYTALTCDEIWEEINRKSNTINKFLTERREIGFPSRHAICIQIEAADLANYAVLLWMEAKVLEIKERKPLQRLKQFGGRKPTVEELRHWHLKHPRKAR